MDSDSDEEKYITPLKTQKMNRCHAHLHESSITQPAVPEKKKFCHGTVRLHRKGMPKDLKPKNETW
jgi:hypothetical protein